MDFDFDFGPPDEKQTVTKENPAVADKQNQKDIVLPVSDSIVFDIETAPTWQPGGDIDAAKKYCRPLEIDFDPDSIGQHPGEFNPDSVKLGRLKDQTKIDAKIEEAKIKHAKAIEDFESKKDGAEAKFWDSIIDNAALSPVTGCVVAIGYVQNGTVVIDDSEDERDLLECFWKCYEVVRQKRMVVTGWNISGFDVPFIIARSAKLGVRTPPNLFARGKWLDDTFVDCMKIWGQMYDPWKRKSSYCGAKPVARFLDCSQRVEGEIEGAQFWEYFLGETREERQQAIDYLTHDVQEETLIAKKLGVI